MTFATLELSNMKFTSILPLLIAALVNLLAPWVCVFLWRFCYDFEWELKTIGIRLLFIGFLWKLRVYIKGAQYTEITSAKGKRVIVTGANAGIGHSLCRELCLRGAEVHMLCRSENRAIEARRKLIEDECPPHLLTYHLVDLADFATVRKFTETFITEVGHLDVVVCNAGLMGQPTFVRTKDENELTYQTNFLAHHLLTTLLLPLLEKSENGRIVNISSIMHEYGDTARPSICNSSDDYSIGGMIAYNRSKLAQVLMTNELSKQLHRRGSNLRVIACHPGNVNSNILQTGYLSFLKYTFLRPLVAFVLKSESDGAQTPLFCCLSEDIRTGSYYHECSEAQSKLHPMYFDGEETRKVFEETQELLGLQEEL